MVKKKTTTGQISARMVMGVLKRHYAFTPDTAVGYDAFKGLRLFTSVIAHTIANLMETDVIMKTDGDRHYFVERDWNKIMHKVSFAYIILLGLPIIILLTFLDIQIPVN